MEDTWRNITEKCAKLDINSAITEAIDVIKEGNYWEELGTQTEIQALIRRHFHIH